MATIFSLADRKTADRWIREAQERVMDAMRGGDPDCIAAAEAALNEVVVAVRQIAKPLVEIGCPRHGCPFVAVAENEGQAVRKIGRHILRAHPSVAVSPMGRVS